MINKIIRINSTHGLHMRVAAEIINITKNSCSRILLECDGCEKRAADGCSLLDMLFLEAPCGKQIRISVDGKDEARVLNKIEQLLDSGTDA